jgi:glycosyltransferase involved in cell wall biosynthesis
VNEVPEILDEGDPAGATGRLVPAEDPAAMAAAFVELGNDAAARRALGQRAADVARVRHSLRAAIDAYHGHYDEVRGLAGAPAVAASAAF